MFKRTLSVVTLLALVLATVGLGTAPATATPAAAQAGSPNAKLLPADTALFVDIRTADLDKTVNFVLGIVEKVTGFRPGNPYEQFDQSLTQFLGRPATFQKDVLSWLGDHITIGLAITDEQIASLQSNPTMMGRIFNRPNALAIIAVKDDAAAQSFMKEVIDRSKSNVPFSSRTDTVGGNQVTIYEQSAGCPSDCGAVVLAKGYIVVGLTTAVNDMLNALKANKPGLADDANFGKLMGALKPDDLLTIYISPRFYQVQLASMEAMLRMSSGMGMLATPQAAGTPEAAGGQMAALRAALGAIQGQAFALRMDGKVLSLNVAQSLNLEAISKVARQLGLPEAMLKGANPPIEGKLVSQIPNKALALVVASGIPNIYQGIQAAMRMAGQMGSQMRGQRTPGFNPAQVEKGIQQFEAALKVFFDLDVKQDILSWMNGEFALYMTYNPTGTLSKLPNGSSWPFDHALLIQTSDTAKTKNFLTKLNAGLEKNAKGTTIKPAGDNLYSLTTSDGIEIGYGLVGDTFLLTTGSGLNTATAAIKGDGTLANSPEWKRAQATMLKPTSQIWYVNFSQITPLLKALAELNRNNDAGSRQALAVLDLLESASLSGGVMQPDGLSLASLQITLK
jgi:hypothetical protein